MYTFHRVFCATSFELERERQAFYDVLERVNETEAMPHGFLLVPVSLTNMGDKRPFQGAVDQNIEACRHYILAITGDWGPPERNFRRDYRLAVECIGNPALPMKSVAVLLEKGSSLAGELLAAECAFAEFDGAADFRGQVRELLIAWTAEIVREAAGAAA